MKVTADVVGHAASQTPRAGSRSDQAVFLSRDGIFFFSENKYFMCSLCNLFAETYNVKQETICLIPPPRADGRYRCGRAHAGEEKTLGTCSQVRLHKDNHKRHDFAEAQSAWFPCRKSDVS